MRWKGGLAEGSESNKNEERDAGALMLEGKNQPFPDRAGRGDKCTTAKQAGLFTRKSSQSIYLHLAVFTFGVYK